jgi:hypothetical protein
MKAEAVMAIMQEVCVRKGQVLWDDMATTIATATQAELAECEHHLYQSRQNCQELRETLAEKDRQIGELVAVIDKIEWSSKSPNGMWQCPVCENHKLIGHRKDCQLSEIIAKYKEAK